MAAFETGCTHKWDCNYPTTPSTIDDVIGTNWLTNVGTTSTLDTTSGQYYLWFDGSDRFARGVTTVLGQTFSLEFVLIFDNSQTLTWASLFRAAGDNVSINGGTVVYYNKNGYLRAESYYTTGTLEWSSQSGTVPNLAPTHLVFTRASNGNCYWYVNGQYNANNNDTGTTYYGSQPNTRFGGPGSGEWKGGLYLCRVFETVALTQSQADQNYKAERWRYTYVPPGIPYADSVCLTQTTTIDDTICHSEPLEEP